MMLIADWRTLKFVCHARVPKEHWHLTRHTISKWSSLHNVYINFLPSHQLFILHNNNYLKLTVFTQLFSITESPPLHVLLVSLCLLQLHTFLSANCCQIYSPLLWNCCFDDCHAYIQPPWNVQPPRNATYHQGSSENRQISSYIYTAQYFHQAIV